jgi:hypothetical protein
MIEQVKTKTIAFRGLFFICFVCIMLMLMLMGMQYGNDIRTSSHAPLVINYKWTKEDCSLVQHTRMQPPRQCRRKRTAEYFQPRQLLITGSARSGTTMVANVITSLFFPFSNDVSPPTKQGMVSWELATPPTHNCCIFWKQNNSFPQFRFAHIFHQVRNPLKAIPSLATEYKNWQRHPHAITQVIPTFDIHDKPPLYLALQVWVEWNTYLDKFKFIPTYRVEDADVIGILTASGFNISESHPHVTRRVVDVCFDLLMGFNTRGGSRQFGWRDVMAIDTSLGSRARQMAKKYGYEYGSDDSLVFPASAYRFANDTAAYVRKMLLGNTLSNNTRSANVSSAVLSCYNRARIERIKQLRKQKHECTWRRGKTTNATDDDCNAIKKALEYTVQHAMPILV